MNGHIHTEILNYDIFPDLYIVDYTRNVLDIRVWKFLQACLHVFVDQFTCPHLKNKSTYFYLHENAKSKHVHKAVSGREITVRTSKPFFQQQIEDVRSLEAFFLGEIHVFFIHIC